MDRAINGSLACASCLYQCAKLSLNLAELPKVGSEFEEITEGEEEDRKQKLKTKWAALEALAGSERRIHLIAKDLVQRFERRLEAMDAG